MKLRGIEFGSVFCAPGTRNFFGEGYPFHRIWRLLGMNWRGTTFVAKTTTLHPNQGNMPLKDDGITPKEFLPKCIFVDFHSGHVLNAVGLSGKGARFLFGQWRWQPRTKSFGISFMAIGRTKEERLLELKEFTRLLKYRLQEFQAPIFLQLNFGCPNAGLSLDELKAEIGTAFDIASQLDIPLVANFNPLVPVKVAVETANHPNCDALWIANTIPWGNEGIDWQEIFGSDESPLTQRGFKSAGGLSGPACLQFVLEKLWQIRLAGVTKPIVAGNGIQTVSDVKKIFEAGASAIAIGTVAIVRPWRMRKIIEAGNTYFCQGVKTNENARDSLAYRRTRPLPSK